MPVNPAGLSGIFIHASCHTHLPQLTRAMPQPYIFSSGLSLDRLKPASPQRLLRARALGCASWTPPLPSGAAFEVRGLGENQSAFMALQDRKSTRLNSSHV